jgi:hypothetical protein
MTIQEGLFHHRHEFGGQKVGAYQGMQMTYKNVKDLMP